MGKTRSRDFGQLGWSSLQLDSHVRICSCAAAESTSGLIGLVVMYFEAGLSGNHHLLPRNPQI